MPPSPLCALHRVPGGRSGARRLTSNNEPNRPRVHVKKEGHLHLFAHRCTQALNVITDERNVWDAGEKALLVTLPIKTKSLINSIATLSRDPAPGAPRCPDLPTAS
ncbi:hypothetical protein EVAR_55217_1 [Eumeta japonica]|uniref:Uncharacterized protein n=1 Tax=Eumeta variegata TaxID=151549 RepID=A0A4C1ZP76_EUMVA|nr:hypothetical protein EVAR_55217_1 [Eumeta japonica]